MHSKLIEEPRLKCKCLDIHKQCVIDVQIDGGKVETVSGFILGFKIIADSECSHEIKRCLLFGRKPMTNLDSVLKSRDIT